jgi:hypothetical protein
MLPTGPVVPPPFCSVEVWVARQLTGAGQKNNPKKEKSAYRTKYPNSGGTVYEVNAVFVIEKWCIPGCFWQNIYGS